MDRYICVHGHFYQPPRENPWLELVEQQDEAYPFHDWNERITAECYAPNARARILDHQGRITRLVNNYARLSFNIGPTLLAWLETEAPDTYAAILEADRRSQQRFGGHGSAMAQAYNHTILPLSPLRDRRTQIRWGIADFRHRFGRDPEGMWLPEAAVDDDTLDLLAEHGITFTVLSPYQAARVRPLQGGSWYDVHGGRVDPTMPYLVQLPSGRSITVFFYDGPISRAVAFEGLLESAERFEQRLLSGFNGRSGAKLVHIATDGESYGHHHRHGEMALAATLQRLAERSDLRVVNYAQFLALHPPTHEAQVIESSSWSCAHGVERWRSDCGCTSGGPESHQRWRGPLRGALDWLAGELDERYELEAGALLADPWAARDDYIEVMLDRSDTTIERFFARHRHHRLSAAERNRALKLLEMQRQAMLMYTSCGWFFEELSRPEPVQILQYAARAIQLHRQLVQDLTGPGTAGQPSSNGTPNGTSDTAGPTATAADPTDQASATAIVANPTDQASATAIVANPTEQANAAATTAAPATAGNPHPGMAGNGATAGREPNEPCALERGFVDRLAMAPSNLAAFGDGRGVWERKVRPVRTDLDQVSAHFAISSLSWSYGETERIGAYVVQQDDHAIRDAGRAKLAVGRLTVRSTVTHTQRAIEFGVLHLGDHNFVCGVRDRGDDAAYTSMRDDLTARFDTADFPGVIRALDGSFPGRRYSLRSLFRDEQRRILRTVLETTVSETEQAYRTIYSNRAPLMRYLSDLSVHLPAPLQSAAENVLNADLRDALGTIHVDPNHIAGLFAEAERFRITLDDTGLAHRLSDTVAQMAHRLADAMSGVRAEELFATFDDDDVETMRRVRTLIDVVGSVPFEVELAAAQDVLWTTLRNHHGKLRHRAATGDDAAARWLAELEAIAEVLQVVPPDEHLTVGEPHPMLGPRPRRRPTAV